MYRFSIAKVSHKTISSILKSSNEISSIHGSALWSGSRHLQVRVIQPTDFRTIFVGRCHCRSFATEVPGKNEFQKLPKKPKRPGSGIGPISWKNMGITFGIGSIILLTMLYTKRKKEIATERERKRALGKASIGGTFDLIDQDGKPCSNENFFGQWILLYFGFTHCPDVCPDEMEKLVEAVEVLDKLPGVPKVQPLFITVDPTRDTVSAVKAYIKEFSPKFIGLTGTKEQVEKATRAYRVYYSAGPQDIDNDYIVDHTIIIYLINPEGEFVDYYGQTKTSQQVADSVQMQMLKYDRMKSKWF